jgi:hypothetical protein
MISELDETIRQLLIKKVPLEPSEVNVSFEIPNREWATSISKPTVNLYLYDIRENHELRAYEWTVERDNNRTATRRRAPLRMDLSYLVTAWTNDVGDEHRLLWRVLATLSRHCPLPEELLQGKLKEQELEIRTTTAQPDGLFRSPADFWSALDSQIKPSINYVVILPLDLEMTETAPIVLGTTLRMNQKEVSMR